MVYLDIFIKNFFSHNSKNFRRETLSCFRIILITKYFLHRGWWGGWLSRFSGELFLSHSTETFCRGIPVSFRNFLVAKTFHALEEGGGGGVSQHSVENFLFRSTETFRKGTFQCFRKIRIRVTKNFMPKNGLSWFAVKNFLSHSTETFCRGNLLCFKKIWYRKSKNFIHKRGGGVSRFSAVLTKLKNVCNGWDLNPYLPLPNLFVLPTVPWEQLETLTNVSEIIKISDTTDIRTRTYCLRNFCPNPTADIYFRIKRVGKIGLKKRKATLLNE